MQNKGNKLKTEQKTKNKTADLRLNILNIKGLYRACKRQ
jgi:hypothetical protein